ncbi:MAG: DUF6394 family protein [Pseudomonadales bacterium]
MNLEKVFFCFFLVLALTLNVAFVVGDSNTPENQRVWLLFAVIAVNLVATVLKLGDRSQVGALLLATALVSDLQLIAAALIWTFADAGGGDIATVVSLATGALVANVVSVTLLVSDTLISGR